MLVGEILLKPTSKNKGKELAVVDASDPRPWMTVELGVGPRTTKEFLRIIKRMPDRHISVSAEEILRKNFPTSLTSLLRSKLDLAVLTVEELTHGSDYGSTEIVFDGATQLGLKRCPVEVGPQVLRQCSENNGQKPVGSLLVIGMKPMVGLYHNPELFFVEFRDKGNLVLGTHSADSSVVWSPQTLWVFVKPRASSS